MTINLTNTTELKELWDVLFSFPLEEKQLVIWALRHSHGTIREAFSDTAAKQQRMKSNHDEMTVDHAIRYASSIMNRVTKEQQLQIQTQ